MSNHMPYISIDSIVNDYILESEQSQHKYYKCWQLAFRGMDNMGLDFFYKIKAVKLPRNDNYTVTLPADFLNWTKVGVLNDRGEVIPLYYNNKLTTYADISPDRLSKTQDDTLLSWDSWGTNVWGNYWTGNGYTTLYGVPSGSPFVGSFKIDLDNGVILLNEDFNYDYIILEYVSSPLEGQEYYIPVQFREALIAWLWWKDKRATNVAKGQIGITRDLKSTFYNERRNAIAQWKPTRIQEAYQASQEQTRLAVKS
jgi:hypothetical protein